MADAAREDSSSAEANGPSRILFAHGPDTGSLAALLRPADEAIRWHIEQSPVRCCRDALEALARSDATLAVLDMTVEGLRGAEGWKRIREAWDRPVVVLCSGDDDACARAALGDGAEDALYREDPSLSVLLRRAISRALARAQDVRPDSKLRELQARWQALDSAQSWYVMEIDGEDRITYMNRTGPGVSPADVCGKSVFAFTHPDAHAQVRERLAHVRRTGEAVTVEERAHGTLGDDSWFFARCLPIKRDGRVASILVVTEDVTERHRIQQLAANSERRFRALVEKSSDAIVLLDRQGLALYASPSTTNVLGFSPEEIVGLDFMTLVHPEDAQPVLSARSELYESPGSHVSKDVRLRHKDGTWRVVHGVGTNLLDDPAVRAVVGNYRDVTSQRALEEQVRRAQQWEAIGLLAGGMAHDFNNLLCVILAAASSAAHMIDQGAPAAVDLEDIRQAAARAAELTRKLLTLGRKQPLTTEYLDAADLISEFAPLMRRTLGEGIEVAVACERPLPVRVDRLQMEQVLLNVCTNARQAMEGRGRLVVEGRCRDGSASHGGTEERVVEIAIRDSGSGMDEATRRRVFEPFFTTKPDGSGLGMTISYGIVQRHGGAMAIESQPGQGTVVTFRLPVREAPPSARVPLDSRPLTKGAGVRILVADDEDPLRRVVCRILVAEGYDVVAAANGEAALATFAEDPAGVALAVLDVRLPRLSGPAVYHRMTSQRPDLPVLFLSGHAPDSETIPPGAPLLLKPFTNEALVRAVQDVAARVGSVTSRS